MYMWVLNYEYVSCVHNNFKGTVVLSQRLLQENQNKSDISLEHTEQMFLRERESEEINIIFGRTLLSCEKGKQVQSVYVRRYE